MEGIRIPLETTLRFFKKCQSKLDCLIFEMFFIRKLKPNLNKQSDSIRAKLFTYRFFMRQFFILLCVCIVSM